MKDIEHPALFQEWIQIFDDIAYEKNSHKDEKLPSTKKKIDRNYKAESWPKSIMESVNWLPILDIMEFTEDKIKNNKNLFPS